MHRAGHGATVTRHRAQGADQGLQFGHRIAAGFGGAGQDAAHLGVVHFTGAGHASEFAVLADFDQVVQGEDELSLSVGH
ncbi:hypothetical protein D3C72_2082570 [compost metagenome]